jgi:hypothetical protein
MLMKIVIGLVATVVGAAWLASSYNGLDLSGIRSIAIPLLMFLIGLNVLVKALRGER